MSTNFIYKYILFDFIYKEDSLNICNSNQIVKTVVESGGYHKVTVSYTFKMFQIILNFCFNFMFTELRKKRPNSNKKYTTSLHNLRMPTKIRYFFLSHMYIFSICTLNIILYAWTEPKHLIGGLVRRTPPKHIFLETGYNYPCLLDRS